MRLSIIIFDGFTTLDAIGGYEVLSRLPGMETEFVAVRRGVIAADTRRLGLVAWREFSPRLRSTDISMCPAAPARSRWSRIKRSSTRSAALDATSQLDHRHLQRRRAARRGRLAQGPAGDDQLVLSGSAESLWRRVHGRALSSRRQICHGRWRIGQHRHRPVSWPRCSRASRSQRRCSSASNIIPLRRFRREARRRSPRKSRSASDASKARVAQRR